MSGVDSHPDKQLCPRSWSRQGQSSQGVSTSPGSSPDSSHTSPTALGMIFTLVASGCASIKWEHYRTFLVRAEVKMKRNARTQENAWQQCCGPDLPGRPSQLSCPALSACLRGLPVARAHVKGQGGTYTNDHRSSSLGDIRIACFKKHRGPRSPYPTVIAGFLGMRP